MQSEKQAQTVSVFGHTRVDEDDRTGVGLADAHAGDEGSKQWQAAGAPVSPTACSKMDCAVSPRPGADHGPENRCARRFCCVHDSLPSCGNCRKVERQRVKSQNVNEPNRPRLSTFQLLSTSSTRIICGSVNWSYSSVLRVENSLTTAPSSPAY